LMREVSGDSLHIVFQNPLLKMNFTLRI
jgi:ABC-type dipeptide/oligopeptide/nickel transport system ATPase component